MKRIRNLGLAAVMALALSGIVGAGSASASAFMSAAYPAEIEGNPQDVLAISYAASGEITCGNSRTRDWSFPAPDNTVSSPPEVEDCETKLGQPVTVEMNGCEFALRSGTQIVKDEEFWAAFGIGPSDCGPVKINIPAVCSMVVYPEEQSSGAHLLNESNEALPDTVLASVEAGFPAHYTNCGGETSAVFRVDWMLEATNEAGLPIDLQVKQVGAYFGAGGFEAEEYPSFLAGSQDPASPHHLKLPSGRWIECADIEFEAVQKSASTSLTVNAEYDSCKTKPILGVSFPVVWKMNSCNYVFHSAGSMDVSCSKEGDAIEAVLSKAGSSSYLCTTKILPQTGLEDVSYTTTGIGKVRGITTDQELAGIEVTGSGAFPCPGAEAKTATYFGTTALRG